MRFLISINKNPPKAKCGGGQLEVASGQIGALLIEAGQPAH